MPLADGRSVFRRNSASAAVKKAPIRAAPIAAITPASPTSRCRIAAAACNRRNLSLQADRP